MFKPILLLTSLRHGYIYISGGGVEEVICFYGFVLKAKLPGGKKFYQIIHFFIPTHEIQHNPKMGIYVHKYPLSRDANNGERWRLIASELIKEWVTPRQGQPKGLLGSVYINPLLSIVLWGRQPLR